MTRPAKPDLRQIKVDPYAAGWAIFAAGAGAGERAAVWLLARGR